MQEKQTFTIQSLVITLILNVILLGAVFYLTGGVWNNQWITILVIGLVITLVLWGILQFLGRRLLDSVAMSAASAEAARLREVKAKERPPVQLPTPAPKPATPPPPQSNAPSVQIL